MYIYIYIPAYTPAYLSACLRAMHAHARSLWVRFLGHISPVPEPAKVELEYHDYWKSELEGILFSNQIPLDAEGQGQFETQKKGCALIIQLGDFMGE